MADLNNCSFTGRLVRDAEKKTIPTGSVLVSFDLANNIGWGEAKKVVYITVNMWGKSGEGVYPYLKKANPVAVTGELELQKWVSRADGAEHTKLVLNCNRLTLLGTITKSDIESSKQDYKYAEPAKYEDEDEDIPF
jgi:single-stranded DNA-binding protein